MNHTRQPLSRMSSQLLGTALLCLCSHEALGLDPAMVKKGKAATALVELRRGTGSAFCVNSKGFFITNQHVVKASERGGKVKLVIRAGETDQKVVEAEVLREDESMDLAILKIKESASVQPLDFGDDSALAETMEVTAFGYPFGKNLAETEDSYPTVSVNIGRITSIRKKKTELSRIQIDAEVNPGNSGGPLLDASGKVIGVIVAGIYGSAVNFAIPASHVQKFLSRPTISFTPPMITSTNISSPVKFTVQALSLFADSAKPISIQIDLKPGNMETKTYEMRPAGDGTYSASLTILPFSRDARMLNLSVDFADGSVRCNVPDTQFDVGAKRLMLHDVSEIKAGPPARITKADGTFLDGKPSFSQVLRTTIGGATVPLDISKAVSVAVADPGTISSIEYTIRPRQGSVTLDEVHGVIGIGGTRKSLPPDLLKDLILHYSFDKDEGKIVSDKSSAKNNASVRGAKWTSSGKTGGGMSFEGNSYISPVEPSAFRKSSRDSFSFGAWFNAANFDSEELNAVMSLGCEIGGTGSFRYSAETGKDERGATVLAISAGSYRIANTPVIPRAEVEAKRWYHVFCVFDAGDFVLYVNGVKVSSARYGLGSTPAGADMKLAIGNCFGGLSKRGFHGVIDEVVFFDRALSAEEVTQLHKAGN